MSRKRTRLQPVLILLGFSIALLLPTSSSVASAQAAVNLTILAGFEDPEADGLEIEAFLPEMVTIRQGDSITWKFTPLEPHTVTFLSGAQPPEEFIELPDGRMAFNPKQVYPSGGPEYDGTGVVNSGLVAFDPTAGPDPSYTLTFTKVGTYEYVCLIHPFMTGRITVLRATAPPPLPQSALDTEAEQEKQGFIDEIEHAGPLQVTARPDGTKEYRLLAGISTQKVDLMHFHEPEITIFVGDAVTWSWERTGAPHTVTFVPRGEDPGPPITVEPQEAGPPNLVLKPEMLMPGDGDTVTRGGFFNSGLLFNPAFGPPGAPGEYSLTFAEPGTYEYFCWLHAPQGMIGKINVSPIRPPKVGGFAVGPLIGSLAGVVGLGFVVSGVYLLRRRARRTA